MDAIGGNNRSLQDITKILNDAKINVADLKPTTQSLYIRDDIEEDQKYFLMELDDHLLSCIKNGGNIMFKGEDEENAVLCTDTQTYDVKECETSNSLLLIPDLEYSKDIQGTERVIKDKHIVSMNYTYFDVTPCKPRLTKILKYLESTKYDGPENEYKVNQSSLMSLDELCEIAQSSDTEFTEMIKKLNVIEIDTKIRSLSSDYQFRTLSFMLKSIDENSWPLDEINREETIAAWSELIPPNILNAVFEIFAVKSKVVDGVQLYKYDEFKVGQFFAKLLLEYAEKFNLEEFLVAWKESLPEDMEISEDMLNGIAIINRKCQPNVIWAFPESKLPENISERFQALFNAKDKWSFAEIKPYIENLTTQKMDVNALLAKYARASNEGGVRCYSSKHDF